MKFHVGFPIIRLVILAYLKIKGKSARANICSERLYSNLNFHDITMNHFGDEGASQGVNAWSIPVPTQGGRPDCMSQLP